MIERRLQKMNCFGAKRICPVCKSEFVISKKHLKYCSEACRNVANAQNAKARHECRSKNKPSNGNQLCFARAIKESARASDENIATAKKKPRNCSDIRWRIELRRRKNRTYYSQFGVSV